MKTNVRELPVIDYGTETGGRDRFWLGMAFVCGAVLTIPSFLVVTYGASREPFLGPIRAFDAVVLLCAASTLVAAWCAYLIVLITLTVRARKNILLIAVFWAVIMIFYLQVEVRGYIADITGRPAVVRTGP
ncbi:MAG TPA: hypothetical protein VF624_03190 [Tepidisphaeraceae bacterium]|jgi:hypothetical protein